MKRIIVTGSRDWDDWRMIRVTLVQWDHPEGVTLVSGACPTGADFIAETVAKELGWTIERHPADWSKGKSAGPRRNNEMAALGADACLAFHRNNSKGTTHMINAAGRNGIMVTEYLYTGVIAGGWGT